jgi:Icc-related predicted phosphoesterase
MGHNILFTSDLHGNRFQYKKLAEYARQVSADSVIIGGDICPWRAELQFCIKDQRRFLEDELPELLEPAKASKIYLMMGNDDASANMDVMYRLYETIHARRIQLDDNFEIIGYSNVPITPFGIKDWEKYDLSDVPDNMLVDYQQNKQGYSLEGIKSTKNGWVPFRFKPEMEKQDSLQKDFENEWFTKHAEKTLYVVHTPPFQTDLDVIFAKEHCGSIALRLFIEKYQPCLTLHGHIHETVSRTGRFQQKIGNTMCMCSGNHDKDNRLAVVVFDLYKPEEAKRIVL